VDDLVDLERVALIVERRLLQALERTQLLG